MDSVSPGMRVILMRHGKPLLPPQQSVTSQDFHKWIAEYDLADICPSMLPSTELIELATNCNAVLCSSLSRSRNSARLLGVNEIYCTDHELREMEMPWGKFFNVALKPEYWAVIFRVLWFCGYSRNSESFKAAKTRAEQAAATIEAIAKQKQSVLFAGHGLLNRFIAKSLVRRGWKAKQAIGSNYWDFGIFELDSP
jgi:Histidine phosphatase superfamily (branch 1)